MTRVEGTSEKIFFLQGNFLRQLNQEIANDRGGKLENLWKIKIGEEKVTFFPLTFLGKKWIRQRLSFSFNTLVFGSAPTFSTLQDTAQCVLAEAQLTRSPKNTQRTKRYLFFKKKKMFVCAYFPPRTSFSSNLSTCTRGFWALTKEENQQLRQLSDLLPKPSLPGKWVHFSASCRSFAVVLIFLEKKRPMTFQSNISPRISFFFFFFFFFFFLATGLRTDFFRSLFCLLFLAACRIQG